MCEDDHQWCGERAIIYYRARGLVLSCIVEGRGLIGFDGPHPSMVCDKTTSMTSSSATITSIWTTPNILFLTDLDCTRSQASSYGLHLLIICAAQCLTRTTPPRDYPTVLFIVLWPHSFHKIMYLYSICLVSTIRAVTPPSHSISAILGTSNTLLIICIYITLWIIN